MRIAMMISLVAVLAGVLATEAEAQHLGPMAVAQAAVGQKKPSPTLAGKAPNRPHTGSHAAHNAGGHHPDSHRPGHMPRVYVPYPVYVSPPAYGPYYRPFYPYGAYYPYYPYYPRYIIGYQSQGIGLGIGY